MFPLAALPLFNCDVHFVSAISFFSVIIVFLICLESCHWQFPIFRIWLSPASFAFERVCVLSVILSHRLHLQNFVLRSSAWSTFQCGMITPLDAQGQLDLCQLFQNLVPFRVSPRSSWRYNHCCARNCVDFTPPETVCAVFAPNSWLALEQKINENQAFRDEKWMRKLSATVYPVFAGFRLLYSVLLVRRADGVEMLDVICGKARITGVSNLICGGWSDCGRYENANRPIATQMQFWMGFVGKLEFPKYRNWQEFLGRMAQTENFVGYHLLRIHSSQWRAKI